MKKLYKTILIAAVVAVSSVNRVSGLEIKTETPGSLGNLVATSADVKELTVSGPLNAVDLFFIGEKMPSLTVLDLGGASITAYDGDMLRGRATYPANTIPSNVFSGMPLTSIVFPATGRIVIDDAAFMGTNIVTLSLPDNVDSVGIGAFAASPVLTTVTYPSANVGRAAFANCPNLTTVEVGGATKIAAEAFRRCGKLTTVTGTEQIVEIGAGAFEGCASLRSFDFGAPLRRIGASAFAASGLESVESLASATGASSIGDQAFANIPTLKAVALPEGTTRIGDGAFFDDAAVGTFTMPSGVVEVGKHAMKGMSGVTNEIVLPETLEALDDYAMAGMTGVTEVDVTALAAVPETGVEVWRGVSQELVTLKVSKDNESAFRNATQWQDFTFMTMTGNIDHVDDSTAVSLRGRFVGTDLEIVCTGSEMATLRLYNVAGVLLCAAEPLSATVTVATAPFADTTYIAVATLSDGRIATLKTAR